MATLVRPRQGKIIAGVCAGLATRFGISVTLIRVAFVVFAVTGVSELVYLKRFAPSGDVRRRAGPRR